MLNTGPVKDISGPNPKINLGALSTHSSDLNTEANIPQFYAARTSPFLFLLMKEGRLKIKTKFCTYDA